MSASDKVKAALACCGKKQVDLARYLGIRRQNLNTKMQRESWSADDLAKVAKFLGAKVGFMLPDDTVICFDPPENDETGSDV